MHMHNKLHAWAEVYPTNCSSGIDLKTYGSGNISLKLVFKVMDGSLQQNKSQGLHGTQFD